MTHDPKSSSPQEQWEALKVFILDGIKHVDSITPWKEVEPNWWLEMMDVARFIREREEQAKIGSM